MKPNVKYILIALILTILAATSYYFYTLFHMQKYKEFKASRNLTISKT